MSDIRAGSDNHSEGRGAVRLLLNLGCGPEVRPSPWTDIDGSWNLRLQTTGWGRVLAPLVARHRTHRWPGHVRWMDITRGLPFDSGSADAVYASHVLEHLYREDALKLLSECRRILKPDGVLRLVLPDLASLARAYLAEPGPDAALRFNAALLMREGSSRVGGVKKLQTLFADFHSHKFMYDAPLLSHDLTALGFREVSERACLDSRIPEIGHVEQAGRILNGAGFVVEALK